MKAQVDPVRAKVVLLQIKDLERRIIEAEPLTKTELVQRGIAELGTQMLLLTDEYIRLR